MAHWLMKSEPDVYGIEHLQREGTTLWDGIRNYQARNFMRQMKLGDLGFFYHSMKEKSVVGIVEVITEAHSDSSTDDDRWECVDIKAVRPFVRHVTLEQIKADDRLTEMVLVKNSRLSVQPVTVDEWQAVCGLGATKP